MSGVRKVAVGALVLLAVRTSAQSPMPVELHVDACASSRPDVLTRIIAIELHASMNQVDATPVVQASIACEADTLVLVVEDRATAKRVERRLQDRSPRPRGWERLLALAMVELVMASWAELALEPPDEPRLEPVETPQPAVVQSARQRLRPSDPRVSTTLLASTAFFSADREALFGGAFRVRWRPIRGVGFALDLGVLAGLERRSDIGDASLFLPFARVSGGYTALVGGASLGIEAGVLAGIVRVRGMPVGGAQGDTVLGAVVVPFGRLGLRTTVGRNGLLGLELELGGAVVRAEVTADDTALVDLGAAYGAFSLTGGVLWGAK